MKIKAKEKIEMFLLLLTNISSSLITTTINILNYCDTTLEVKEPCLSMQVRCTIGLENVLQDAKLSNVDQNKMILEVV